MSKIAESWRSTPASLTCAMRSRTSGSRDAEALAQGGVGPGLEREVPLHGVEQLAVEVVELGRFGPAVTVCSLADAGCHVGTLPVGCRHGPRGSPIARGFGRRFSGRPVLAERRQHRELARSADATR